MLLQKIVFFTVREILKNKISKKVLIQQKRKVGLSPSEKICFDCFIEIPLKMMKNAFYFNLKALFVLKIFKFLS